MSGQKIIDGLEYLLASMPGWEPIETAPRDGTLVNLLCEGGEDRGYWDGEWSTDLGLGEPSGWRPFMGGIFRRVS